MKEEMEAKSGSFLESVMRIEKAHPKDEQEQKHTSCPAIAGSDVELVMLFLRAHSADADVQSSGLFVLGACVKSVNVDMPSMFLVVCSAMRSMPRDAHLQRKGCAALYKLTEDRRTAEYAVLECLVVVHAAMQDHPNSSELQGLGCAVLGNLACSDERREQVWTQGGVEAVLVAMEKHHTESWVVLWGCSAIQVFAVSEANRQRMWFLGAVQTVLQGMETHLEEGKVQREGLGALSSLAPSPSAVTDIVMQDNQRELDHVEMVVLKVMQRHQDDLKVQCLACETLCRVLSFTACVGTGQKRIAELVHTAIKLHPSSGFHKFAFDLLRQLVFGPSVSASADLEGVIKAMRTSTKNVEINVHVVVLWFAHWTSSLAGISSGSVALKSC